MESAGYTEKFRIRSFEMDANGRASLQTICNFLQEIAGIHADRLGVSVMELLRHGMTWVLSRLHLKMTVYPRWGETITIETWPSGMSGMFGLREFSIRNDKKDVIGMATTSWMVLDIAAKKAIELPAFISAIPIVRPERIIDDNFHKLPVPKDPPYKAVFSVRRSDLDINHHVNNVSYIEWAAEAIPPEIMKDHFVSGFEISYRAECHYGDRILSECAPDKDGTGMLHALKREADQSQVAVVRTALKPAR
jgi:medium-chain acyl-[acyl-carrier-protein] hydrolase